MLATPSSSSSSSSNTCAVKSAPMHCRRAASSHCTRTDSLNLAAGSLSSSSRGRDRQRCDTPTAPKSTALIDILLECTVKHKVRSNAKRSNTCASAMRTHRQPSHRPAPTGSAQLPAGRRAATQCGQRRSGPQWAGRSRDRDRYRSLTLDCCRPHHTIAHVWARLPGAAISGGTHSRPSRWHLLQASSKSAPHATLALWHARHARFCVSLPSEGQSRPNRHEQRELI